VTNENVIKSLHINQIT